MATATGEVTGTVIGGSTGATDNAVLRADGAGGLTLQSSLVTIDDVGVQSGVTQLNVDNIRLDGGTVSTLSGGLTLASPGAQAVAFNAGGGNRWNMNSNGHLVAGADNTYDIGAGGATRPRNVFVAGYVLVGRLIEASIAGSGTPNLLAVNESRTLLTNEGATAENYHTLPLAVAGLEFIFYCHDADGIRVVANTADTIRLGASVSAAAGYVRSSTIGSCITLVAINATEWVATSIGGTWTVDS